MAAPNQRERDEAIRQEKLADIDQLVKDGSLVIRQMTPAEKKKWAKRRAENPIVAEKPRRGRGR